MKFVLLILQASYITSKTIPIQITHLLKQDILLQHHKTHHSYAFLLGTFEDSQLSDFQFHCKRGDLEVWDQFQQQQQTEVWHLHKIFNFF